MYLTSVRNNRNVIATSRTEGIQGHFRTDMGCSLLRSVRPNDRPRLIGRSSNPFSATESGEASHERASLFGMNLMAQGRLHEVGERGVRRHLHSDDITAVRHDRLWRRGFEFGPVDLDTSRHLTLLFEELVEPRLSCRDHFVAALACPRLGVLDHRGGFALGLSHDLASTIRCGV